jgi:hypothetical protein
MNLQNRISQLERTLSALPCNCPNSADLAWPGHEPDTNCPRCGGKRLIYPLANHPRSAEPLIREALPLIKKAYGANTHADLSKLNDQELHQLKTALQAVDHTAPTNTPHPHIA